MKGIVVHVSGGCVSAVYADDPEVTVELADWDNAECDEEAETQCKRLDQECQGMTQIL
jgi:hypothetical protein